VSAALRRLTFAMPTGTPVLTDLDLDLAAGSHIGILGPSGSGKSTLIEALARLRPFEGDIRMDGVPLDHIGEAEFRSRLTLIGQRPRLFPGTIADNIRLARPDACDTIVAAAARRALVTDGTGGTPLGLDTRIGENGLGLSGGQAQRVALARLYLRDPGIILLDEPTAHLDAATEARVLDNLLLFARGQRRVIATHSAPAAARMNRVFRIAGGKLLPPVGHTHADHAMRGAA
jgi:ATP-binding cassette subfamily C protein CydD